jgi:type IV secretory pathway TrbD component
MTVERLVFLAGIVAGVVALALAVWLGRAFGLWGVAVIPPVVGALYAAWLRARGQFSYLDRRTLEELPEK